SPPQLLAIGRRGNEELLRISPILQHLVENLGLVIIVGAKAGQILQSEITIAVDLRIFEPRLQIGGGSRKRREQIETGVKADLIERLGDSPFLSSAEPRVKLFDIDP